MLFYVIKLDYAVTYNDFMGHSGNSYKILFGRRLKKIRKLKKYTQEQLAEKIGINIRQLARIEAGESFLTIETLQNICNVLYIKPSVLFDFEEENLENNAQTASYGELKNMIAEISEDENKIYFIITAINALKEKNSLAQLKLLIKGLDLNN